MNASSLNRTPLVIALVAAGIVGGAGATYALQTHTHAAAHAAIPTASAQPAPVSTPDFSQIAARYGAAVVNVSVSGMTRTANDGGADSAPGSGRTPRMDPGNPLFEFFRHFQGPNGMGPGPSQTPVHGQGSGFIVSADGLVLTNAHVVRDARDVTVKLTDRREFQAKVLGADPKTDVAVLKIDAKSLPTVPLGSARDLKVGEWVLAIGSPFGFDNSVTVGVVSAKGRSLPDDSFVPFIQTDVAVNPGNSGGPLFNTRGEVVGINSQIFSRTGGYQGLSFAIPIDVAASVEKQIVATGKATHARLGVTIQEVNQTLADSFKLDKPAGALVSGVEAGAPADKAGLKAGDVILRANGQEIVASSDLPALIGRSAPGDKVVLEIWRQGSRVQLDAKLADASDAAAKVAAPDQLVGRGRLGLALRPLRPQELREAGVEYGLMIEDSSGPSAQAGIQPGDVLITVNGTPARSVEGVRATLARVGTSVALLIERDGDRIFVPVRIG